MVRYADDFVVGFEHRSEAELFQEELSERLSRFNLTLNEEKTRLIEFGRKAAENRQQRGERKPETFNFLGFTHICGKTRNGKFQVVRKTMRKRMQAKLKTLKGEFRRRMHSPLKEQGEWVGAVLRGHYQYYGVPLNSQALESFAYRVKRLWHRALKRRSQKARRLTWAKFKKVSARWTPAPRSVTRTLKRDWRRGIRAHTVVGKPSQLEIGAGCGNSARPDLWRGYAVMRIPTPTQASQRHRIYREVTATRFTQQTALVGRTFNHSPPRSLN